MTTPDLSVTDLLKLAKRVGCVGVEFRNDLGRGLFDDQRPEDVAELALRAGIRILALAEVKAFNDPATDLETQAETLIATAAVCNAEGVALIPRVASERVERDAQRAALKQSLFRLKPILEDHDMVGLIEPLGFENSTLRYKADVVATLDDMGRPGCFRMIHDTFHHHLAQTDTIHADLTALVHISGVSDPKPDTVQMADDHRVLVGQGDRLGNTAQIRALRDNGYDGALSFEAFAPEIHQMTDPATALAGSIDFIADQMAREMA